MRITRIDTLTCDSYPGAVWLEPHTDEGLVGLGETWAGPAGVTGYIHQVVAPYLLRGDPLAIEFHDAG